MEKKKYTALEMEIIKFDTEDVITESDPNSPTNDKNNQEVDIV